jgi:hypothetical protein
MTTPAKKTQGSTLFVVNSLVSPATVIPIPFIKDFRTSAAAR